MKVQSLPFNILNRDHKPVLSEERKESFGNLQRKVFKKLFEFEQESVYFKENHIYNEGLTNY